MKAQKPIVLLVGVLDVDPVLAVYLVDIRPRTIHGNNPDKIDALPSMRVMKSPVYQRMLGVPLADNIRVEVAKGFYWLGRFLSNYRRAFHCLLRRGFYG